MRIMVTCSYYAPGWKGGGPIRSLSNLVELLGDEFDFRVVTRDRDLGDTQPYPDILQDQWQKVGKAEVLYLSSENRTLGAIQRILRETPCDLLYLNSFFSPDFTVKPLLLRRLGRVPRVPALLAPRGEFANAALNLKAFRKRVFIAFARVARLCGGISWHATGARELPDFNRILGADLAVFCVPDVVRWRRQEDTVDRAAEGGALRVVFLSRICRMKNLYGAVDILRRVKGSVQFDVYGPIEDAAYWRECESLMASMPDHIGVAYRGPLPHDRVVPTLSRYDLFFLPTLGENFGHVIAEALMAGCPLLISDQTPWRNLRQERAGWDLPLDRPDLFAQAIEESVNLDPAARVARSSHARNYGTRVMQEGDRECMEGYREMFRKASEKNG